MHRLQSEAVVFACRSQQIGSWHGDVMTALDPPCFVALALGMHTGIILFTVSLVGMGKHFLGHHPTKRVLPSTWVIKVTSAPSIFRWPRVLLMGYQGIPTLRAVCPRSITENLTHLYG